MSILILLFYLFNLFLNLNLLKFGRYSFFSANSLYIAWWSIIFCCISFVGNNRFKWLFYLISAINAFITTSGLGIFCISLLPIMYYFFEKKQEIKWYYVVLIIVFGCFIGKNEIQDYLMNPNEPRNIMPYFAFITANNCFPIGSGFATFGGNTAIFHYSNLYKKYGFESLDGMSSEQSNYLMDTYYPLIIAQFGYLGIFIFSCFFYIIFKKYIWIINNRNIRCYSLFLFMALMVAGLGFGTGSNWGCMIYLTIAILFKMSLSKESIKIGENNV